MEYSYIMSKKIHHVFYNNNIWIIVGQGSNNQNDNIAWINNPSDLNKGFMSSWNKSNGAALPGVKGVSWSEKHKLWVASPFMPGNFLYSTDGKSWNTGTKATNFSSNAWGAGFIAPASSSQLEFVWNKLEYEWNQNFTALETYKAKFGHVNVPHKYKTTSGLNLGKWCSHRRNNYKNNK